MNIIFDLDDTLFPTGEFAELARKKAIRAMISLGLNEKEEPLYKRLMHIISKKGSNYENHFDDLCRELKIRDNSKFVAAAIAAYHDAKMAIQPYPEIPSILLTLRDRGYRLYVATNGQSVKQWDKLIRLGIALYFGHVFVSSELKEEKGIGFYKKILKRLRAKPSECVMIGDREDCDIVPAKKVGMHTIRVKKGKHAGDPSVADFEVQEISDIMDIVEKFKNL
jgi:putative hydrolase of the HAD superfamily